MEQTLWCNPAILGQETAKRVDGLRALTHDEIPRSEHCRAGLLLFALDRHKPHGRALRRLADRLRIGGIVLLPLYVRLHILWRDQANVMAHALQLARPVMRAAARLHRHRGISAAQQITTPASLVRSCG